MKFRHKKELTEEEFDKLEKQAEEQLGNDSAIKLFRVSTVMAEIEKLSPMVEISEAFFDSFIIRNKQAIEKIVTNDSELMKFLIDRQKNIDNDPLLRDDDFDIQLPSIDELNTIESRVEVVNFEFIIISLKERLNEIKQLKNNN